VRRDQSHGCTREDEQRQRDQRDQPRRSSTRSGARHHLRRLGSERRRRRSGQQAEERPSVRRPFSRLLGKCRPGDLGEPGRSTWSNIGHCRGRLVQLVAEEVDRVRRLEWQPPRQHPEQEHPERVDVARGRDRLPGRLLGRHVRRSPDERAGVRQRVRTRHPGDAEVRDLRPPFFVEDDVRRLEVAMDESALVRVREPGGNLGRDRLRFRIVERLTRRQAILERAARQVLEDHVRPSPLAPVVEEPADVRMRERGDRMSFPLETGRVGVAPEALERYEPVELCVRREPDFGHRTRPEPLLEAITARDRLAHP
jgi:hypothetical protein